METPGRGQQFFIFLLIINREYNTSFCGSADMGQAWAWLWRVGSHCSSWLHNISLVQPHGGLLPPLLQTLDTHSWCVVASGSSGRKSEMGLLFPTTDPGCCGEDLVQAACTNTANTVLFLWFVICAWSCYDKLLQCLLLETFLWCPAISNF